VRDSLSETLVVFAVVVGAVVGACTGTLVTLLLYQCCAADQINEWFGIQMAYTLPAGGVVGGLAGCALALWRDQPANAARVCLFGGGAAAVVCALVLVVGPPGYVGMEYNGPCILGPPLLGTLILVLCGWALAHSE
jgi:hypothetical protein